MEKITFFEILSPVLDRGIQSLAKTEKISLQEVYERICTEIGRNHNEWFSNTVPSLNYNLPECRLAYLYVVAAANANTFKTILTSNADLQNYIKHLATTQQQVRICAFGAGPGTELLAIAKYFCENPQDYPISIDFLLLDKVKEWTNSWFGIRDEIHCSFIRTFGINRTEWPIIPAGNFLTCDVTQVNKLGELGDVWHQDIYVLNFILSEIFRDDPGFHEFVGEVASNAPQGSRFIFIERNGQMWAERMMRIASKAGLQLSPFYTSNFPSLDLDEDPNILGETYKALSSFGYKPRKAWNVVFSIGLKV